LEKEGKRRRISSVGYEMRKERKEWTEGL